MEGVVRVYTDGIVFRRYIYTVPREEMRSSCLLTDLDFFPHLSPSRLYPKGSVTECVYRLRINFVNVNRIEQDTKEGRLFILPL